MLEDIFKKSDKYFHIIDAPGRKLPLIGEDCPSDRFEQLKRTDKEYFSETGKHLYANFEEEDKE